MDRLKRSEEEDTLDLLENIVTWLLVPCAYNKSFALPKHLKSPFTISTFWVLLSMYRVKRKIFGEKKECIRRKIKVACTCPILNEVQGYINYGSYINGPFRFLFLFLFLFLFWTVTKISFKDFISILVPFLRSLLINLTILIMVSYLLSLSFLAPYVCLWTN